MDRYKIKIKELYIENKNKLIKIYKNKLISKYIKDNIFFFLYVLVNIINSTYLRIVTIKTWENFFSIRAIISDLLVITLIGSIGYLYKPQKRIRFFFIVTLFFTAISLINSIYYTFYTSFASVSMLVLVKNVTAVGDAVVENIIQIKDVFYLIGPILFYIFYKKNINKVKYKKIELKSSRIKKFKMTLNIAAVLAILFFVSIKAVDFSRLVKQWNREYIVMRFGIYIYQGNDLVASVQPKISSMFGKDKAKIMFDEYFKDKNNTSKNSYTDIFKGKNILMIHGESMMTNAMNLKFNGQEVTPNLNKMASEGMFFSNFYSQVSVGTSSDAEFTSTTSLMPTKSGTAFVSYYDREYISMMNLLKKQNYYTFSMHANNGNFWNRKIMYDSLKYDDFFDKSNYKVTKDKIIGLGLSDKEFFSQSIPKLEKINNSKKNWYGLMIMLSNHTPFSDVEHYGEFDVNIKEKVINENGVEEEKVYPYMEGTKLGNYFKSLHYADSALGDFLDNLKNTNILDNTVVILYGDHDARLPKKEYNFLENYNKETNDIYDSSDPRYKEYDYYKYELGRKVPLIIWTKDMKGTKLNFENKNVMGMYDLAPTMGNMFGFYNKYALGRDIYEIKDKNIVIFPNSNWVNNKVYYNSQRGEIYPITNEQITEEEIKNNSEYTNKLLDVSNDIVLFNLLKNK